MQENSVQDDVATCFDELVAGANGAMVAVVARSADDVGSCLVGFHCQCSIEPRRYAVWLSKANHTFKVAMDAPQLAVHWLREDQRGMAVALGSISADAEPRKLERVELGTDSATGALVLADCAGYFVGSVSGRHDDGDHVCFVLDIDSSSRGGRADRLRFRDVADLTAGHEAGEPEHPAS